MITYYPSWSLYWPNFDEKRDANYRYIQKHLVDMDYAISKCNENSVCIQAGGHVGLWPIKLSKNFDRVITFEAEPNLYKALEINVSRHAFNPVDVYNAALSDEAGLCGFKQSTSSGSCAVSNDVPATTLKHTVDNLVLPACDVIFLDIEGHEYQALQGARKTIERFRPVIQVEENNPTLIDSFLVNELGYSKDKKVGNDRVYLP